MPPSKEYCPLAPRGLIVEHGIYKRFLVHAGYLIRAGRDTVLERALVFLKASMR